MKAIRNVLFFGFLFGLAAAPNAFGQDCTPPNPITFVVSTEYIANPAPTSSDCWNVTNATVVSIQCPDIPEPLPENAFEFAIGGHVYQSFKIPDTSTYTRFTFQYTLDFNDPHNDGFDYISGGIFDRTTNQWLAWMDHTGGMPNLACAQFNSNYNANLAGHQLEVHFFGETRWPDTHVRVGSIFFWGS